MGLKPLPHENMQAYIFRIGQLKDVGAISESWNEIAEIINKYFVKNTLSYKKGKTYANIYAQVKNFYDAGVFDNAKEQLEELKKEKIKIQTLNIERNRIDRNIARQELYYEQIGSACSSLPFPDYAPLKEYVGESFNKKYLLTLSDIHYGAAFKCGDKEYSPDIVRNNFEYLTSRLITFITDHNIETLYIVSLGDLLQGIIRTSDLKINDSAVVKSTVEISRLIALFLVELSEVVRIEYYHVMRSNHTQIKPLGTKANELMDEDLEYVIGHYIKDLCAGNERINIHLQNDDDEFIKIPIWNYDIYAAHGHHVKNISNALKDLSVTYQEFIDYLILGHYHHFDNMHGWESSCHDTEVILAPSFAGTDPYSKSIMRTSHGSVLILGFDEIYGHTETYKIYVD